MKRREVTEGALFVVHLWVGLETYQKFSVRQVLSIQKRCRGYKLQLSTSEMISTIVAVKVP